MDVSPFVLFFQKIEKKLFEHFLTFQVNAHTFSIHAFREFFSKKKLRYDQ